jgi:hypothetical protein
MQELEYNMKKNLIIGGFTNYNYTHLKPWVESALWVNNSKQPFEIVMVAGNTTKETVDTLTQKGIQVVGMEAPPNLPPHLPRWIAVYDFLKKHGHKYENVVSKKTVNDVTTSLKGKSQLVGSCQFELELLFGQVFLTTRYKIEVTESVIGKLKFR